MDGRELLDSARRALDEHVRTGRAALPPRGGRSPGVGGLFVSLHLLEPSGRELRGCIGTLDPGEPLARAAAAMAVAAASRDPRFPPLRREELDSVEVEISVLSPMRRLASANDLEVGVHGLNVSRGPLHGLLLPQVAVEHGWDREHFLGHACWKADLGWESWRHPDTLVEVFTAEVFRDP
jgi:AmmeMemoRadiSam system protein A